MKPIFLIYFQKNKVFYLKMNELIIKCISFEDSISLPIHVNHILRSISKKIYKLF